MIKWLTDWLQGKTVDSDKIIHINPFPAAEKAQTNPQINEPVTETKKIAKPKANKKPEAKPSKSKSKK